MSKIDYQALRAKAEKATCGEWSLEYGEGRFDGDDALIHREVVGYIPICRIEGAHHESGFDEDFQMEQQANAEFIAAANPATVLTLLDELETAKKRIAELESEPVRQTYKLPQTQFEQVADLYEMQFDDGRTCAFHTDAQKAAQWLQACEGNRVQEYVKLERLRNALSGNPHVTPARLPGGFTIEDAKELHEDLVRSHISQALSGEKMKKKDRDADLRWIHGVIVQAAWFVKASLEQNALTGDSPGTPDGWISCSDRMPDDGQHVIILCDGAFVLYAQYRDSEFFDVVRNGEEFFETQSRNVTHWMPLPEPPKGEK
ncbi:TPA: ead/Ea22-like family protein [Escherichia coli]|nr:ead/Ea22-like family protein [Escherichia coli]